MRAFASFVNFVIMMYQRVPVWQQREWGLLKKKNHEKPTAAEALPNGYLSMDAEDVAWSEQRARETGFVQKAIALAVELSNADHVELDIETGVPTHSHEIPLESTDLCGSFANSVPAEEGSQASEPTDDFSEIHQEVTEELDENASMYKRNNVTMLPIIQAELGSTTVVSAIMLFFIGLRDKVFDMWDTRKDGSAGASTPVLDKDGDEEVDYNIMRWV